MTLMIRRVSVDGDLISISNPSVRFQKVTGAAHTPHKSGAKRKLLRFAWPGCSNIEAPASKQSDAKFQQKKKLFVAGILDIQSN